MTLRLREVRKACMGVPGLWDELLSRGKVLPDSLLEISREEFDSINQRYFGRAALGNLVHEVIKPVAAAADAVLGTGLQDCGVCGERQLRLNSGA
jgi:hypothetical protein